VPVANTVAPLDARYFVTFELVEPVDRRARHRLRGIPAAREHHAHRGTRAPLELEVGQPLLRDRLEHRDQVRLQPRQDHLRLRVAEAHVELEHLGPAVLHHEPGVEDAGVADAVAGSFLGKLPSDLVDALVEVGERIDYPAGSTIYRQGSFPRTLLVVGGLLRVYMSSPVGRQVTVRYARTCDVLGIAVLVGGRPMSVYRRWPSRACSGSTRGD